MSERKILFFLILIMITVSLVIVGITVPVLYKAALIEQQERLVVIAQSQARLIEAIARFDAANYKKYHSHAEDLTGSILSQIIDAHKHYKGFGKTGEFTLARREGDQIVFLLRHRHYDLDHPKPISFTSQLAQPMRLALSGNSGTVVGPDYRGKTVLAAYEPVALLNFGIVAKIDLAEVREPFISAGAIAVAASAIAVLCGAILFHLISSPMIKNFENRALELKMTNEQLQREIEERKKTEETLQKKRDLVQMYLDIAGVIFVALNVDGEVSLINKKGCEILGYDENEILGKNWFDNFLPEKNRQKVKDVFQQLMKGEIEPAEHYDNPILNKNGAERMISWHNTVLKNEKGAIGGTFSSGEDITYRRQAEEQRVLLSTAIEQAVESVIISDRPGTIQYVNPAFERLSSYDRKDIVGQRYRILKSDKHDEAFYRDMWNIISRGKIWSGRITNRMKDGTLREFETIISPVHDSLGEITNFVSVNRDITQEVALGAQLRQSQKMESIGTLAGGIAHDFNNILSAVIGYTELALVDAEKETVQHKNLQQVLVAGNRAKDLVQQILTFSRQSYPENKPVNVQHVAKEALKLIRASIPTTIEIKQNIQSEELVMGDATQIHQIIMNLCTNAAHAMEDTGGIFEIDLSDVKFDSESISNHPDLKPGPYIHLTVTDTGHGIAPDVLNKIFDPFFTTKEKGEGTGMGLAVVHGIVNSHGGTIYAGSAPGKGSTFNVYLPGIERALASEVTTEEPLPIGTERILFIDDEQPITNIGRQTLESLGYVVVTRTSSIEALELFKAQKDKFDLVITDMTMPQMTGEKLAKALIRLRPDIPVILCTGFSTKIDEKKAMAMGIRAFVSKPVLKREIAKTVRAVLDG